MNKKIVVAVASLLVVAVAVPVLFWRRTSGTRVTTTVSVSEGSVFLYAFDDHGQRVFRRAVEAGETASVTARIPERRPMSETGLLGPLLADTLTSFMAQVETFAQRLPDGTFTRVYTEKEFSDLVARKLSHRLPVQNVRVALDKNGFVVEGRFVKGPLRFGVIGSGMVEVNHDYGNRLFLRIFQIKVGPLYAPDFVLSKLEDTFAEIVSSTEFPIEILEMRYEEKGIAIIARRRR